MCKNIYMCIEVITIATPNNKTKPYNLAYCWIPDLENQEWQVENLYDGMPTLLTHPAIKINQCLLFTVYMDAKVKVQQSLVVGIAIQSIVLPPALVLLYKV